MPWKVRGGNTATLLATDSTTKGSWSGVYGSDWYIIADGGLALSGFSNLPHYAHASVGGFSLGDQLWATSTSDVRGVQQPGNLTRPPTP